VRKHLIRSFAVAGLAAALLAAGGTSALAAPDVTLTVDDKGAASTVASDVVVVTGTLECSESADLWVYAEVSQTKGDENGWADGGTTIDCDADETVSWRLATDYGYDVSKGLASVTARVYTIDEDGYTGELLAKEETTAILQECSIIGSREADDLEGSWRNDVICGLGGSDSLAGDSGSDRIVGGDGSDVIYGQKGDDTLLGGPGSDWPTRARAPRSPASSWSR